MSTNPILGAIPFLIAAAAIVIMRSGVFVASDQSQARPAAQRGPAATTVQVAAASVGPISDVQSYSGAIQSTQQVNVDPRVSGIVQNILVEAGQSVKQGDLLVQMDPGTLP